MAAFREHFVKSGDFTAEDSHAYGEAFERRTVADYEMLGKADPVQARNLVKSAGQFVEHCVAFLVARGYR